MKKKVLFHMLSIMCLASCGNKTQNDSFNDSIAVSANQETVIANQETVIENEIEEIQKQDGISGDIVIKWENNYDLYRVHYDNTYTLTLKEDGSADCERIEYRNNNKDYAYKYHYHGGWETELVERGSKFFHAYRINMNYELEAGYDSGEVTWFLNEDLSAIFMGDDAYHNCIRNLKAKSIKVDIISGKENFVKF